MTRTTFAATIAALAVTTGAAAQSPTIAEIARPDAIAVVSIDNFAQMHEALEGSFLGDMWNDPEIKSFLKQLLDESGMIESFNEEEGPAEW